MGFHRCYPLISDWDCSSLSSSNQPTLTFHPSTHAALDSHTMGRNTTATHMMQRHPYSLTRTDVVKYPLLLFLTPPSAPAAGRPSATQPRLLSPQRPQLRVCKPLATQQLPGQQQQHRRAARLQASNSGAPSAEAIEVLRVENELLKQTIADTQSSIAELEAGEWCALHQRCHTLLSFGTNT